MVYSLTDFIFLNRLFLQIEFLVLDLLLKFKDIYDAIE